MSPELDKSRVRTETLSRQRGRKSLIYLIDATALRVPE
jgi:hypothetical protein